VSTSWSAALSVVAFGACARAPVYGNAPDAGGPQPVTTALGQPTTSALGLDDLREEARDVLDRNCGDCHTTGSPKALRRALAVYDLAQFDWSGRMSDAQLRDAQGRLSAPNALVPGGGEARAVKVSADELAHFRRYVELEVQRRGSGN
jgi:hypothetical protein